MQAKSNTCFRGLVSLALAVCCLNPVTAATARDLLDMSIEDLLAMEITSVAGKRQPLSRAASAVFVITRDDIRRIGAASIPEALRLAPGLSVSQIDANKWAIGSRGFQGRFANTLLVLMDGRTLYTPSFSGVFWDAQATSMDNIERIEVIRGPGGTLWGSNAVNGIINIITRDSRSVGGGVATSSASDRGSLSGSVLLAGGDANLGYRAFAKYDNVSGNKDSMGTATADDWRQLRGGTRVDWAVNPAEHLFFSMEAYTGDSGDTQQLGLLTPPYRLRQDATADISGFNALARWTKQGPGGDESSVQVFWDSTKRAYELFGEERQSVEFHAQRRFVFGQQDLVTGFSGRVDSFDFDASGLVRLNKLSSRDSKWTMFIQDEFSLADNRLLLTLGSKFEFNELSPRTVEILPTLRASWSMDSGGLIWTSVTRAVRTPSLAEKHLEVSGLFADSIVPPLSPSNPLPIPVQVRVQGNPDQRSEVLTALEAGYRAQLGETFSLDVAAFVNRYSRVRNSAAAGLFCDSTGEPIIPPLPPACVFTSSSAIQLFVFDNTMSVDTLGFEVSTDWRLSPQLRLVTNYAFLDVDTNQDPDGLNARLLTGAPKHELSTRFEYAPREQLDVGVLVGFTEKSALNDRPRRINMTVRAAWRPHRSIELSLVARDLLDRSQPQFVSELADLVPVVIQPSLTAGLRWSF